MWVAIAIVAVVILIFMSQGGASQISNLVSGWTGGNLSPDALYSLATSVGFPPDTAVKMVAIAMKESGGNPNAHNSTPPDDSYGLWQINMFKGIDPRTGKSVDLLTPRLAQFQISDPSQLFDPTQNAVAALIIWGGNDNNLSIAWAINDGGINQSRYQSFLPIALQAQNRVDGTVVATNADGTVTG